MGIRKTFKRAVGWLVAAVWKPAVPNGFASRRYNLTDDGKYESPLCSERYKYPLRAYPSLHNKFKQSVLFKHQSQVTGEKKKKKSQKDFFFKHYSSSYTLQRYTTQYNTTPLFCFFFLHSLLWFLGFSQMIVWWLSFHFDFLSLFNIFCFDNFNSQRVPLFCCHLIYIYKILDGDELFVHQKC